MVAADLPACDELRQIAGWNQTFDDWRRFLALSPGGCFVAEIDGAVVGTVTTVSYEREVGWIGMLLVRPDTRGHGIGKALLLRAIEHLQNENVPCIKLDATPKGEPLYRGIGFQPEWTLTRFVLNGTPVEPGDCIGRDVRETDLPEVIALDAEAFGVMRAELIRRLCASARRALVMDKDGLLAGFGLLRAGAVADYLGPVVAKSTSDAMTLVAALISAVGGRPIYWDVPEPIEAAVELARKFGFEVQRPLLRMFLGETNLSGDVTKYYGLVDPALG